MNFLTTRYLKRLDVALTRLVVLFVVQAPGLANAQSVSVPLSHPVYDFLERMETYDVLSPFALRVQPLSRAEVFHMLHHADSLRAASLTLAEKAGLQRYLAEFTGPAIGASTPRDAEPHLLRLEEGKSQIFVDALATQSGSAHQFACKRRACVKGANESEPGDKRAHGETGGKADSEIRMA